MDVDMESTPKRDPSSKTPKTHIKKKRKNSSVTVEADLVKEQQGTNPPITGYFPCGFGHSKGKKQQSDDSSDITTFRNEKKIKRVELVLKPNTNDKVDYVGSNYSGEAAAGKIGAFGLVFIDWGVQKFRCVPVVSGRVIRLEPKVRRADMSDKEPETTVNAELTAVDRMQQNNTLTELYGTSGARKQARRAQRLRQKEDPEAHEKLNQILDETPVDKAAIESTTTGANPHIPPYNLTATEPARAYPLEKIILKGEWDYLTDILELVQAGEEINPGVYPSFVCNRSHKVQLVKDEAERMTVAGILSYITHLVNFKKKHSLDSASSAKGPQIPSMLYQKFSRMFVDENKHRLADNKIGALISYVCVLTLHVDEFQSDFTDIAQDLMIPAFSVRSYFENLGCKLARRNKVTVATLPVPLQFPTMMKKRRRG